MISFSGFTQIGGPLLSEDQQVSTSIADHLEVDGLSSLAAFDTTLSQALVPYQPIALRPSVVVDLIAQFEANGSGNNAEPGAETDEQNQQLLNMLLNIQPENTSQQPRASMVASPVMGNMSSMFPPQRADHESMAKGGMPVVSLLSAAALDATPSLPSVNASMDSSSTVPIKLDGGIAGIAIMPSAMSNIANREPDVASPPVASQLTLSNSQKEWPEQLRTALGERLQLQIDNKVQQATIRLDPPDMGKIDISLQIESGKLQVHINANQGDVYRALQQSSAELRQTLIGQGSNAVQVQVSTHSHSHSHSQQQQQQRQNHSPQQPDILAAQHIETSATMNADDGTLLTTI